MKTAFVVRSVIWRIKSLPGQVRDALHSGLLSSGGTASPAAGAESEHLNELLQVLGESSSQPGCSFCLIYSPCYPGVTQDSNCSGCMDVAD